MLPDPDSNMRSTSPPNSVRLLRRALLGFAAFGIAVGALFVVDGIDDGREARSSLEWPVTRGQIGVSWVEQIDSSTGRPITERSLARRDAVKVYRPFVAYQYMVKGIMYPGHRISFEPLRGSADRAQRVVNRYSMGRIVDVYYDPDDPSSAVLESGPSTNVSQRLVFGLVLMVVTPGLAGASYWLTSRLLAAAATQSSTPSR